MTSELNLERRENRHESIFWLQIKTKQINAANTIKTQISLLEKEQYFNTNPSLNPNTHKRSTQEES